MRLIPLNWNQRRFEPFVLASLDLLDGVESSEIASLESPYREVMESLEDDGRLRDALSTACDYHVANVEDEGDEWDPEFKEPPFDLLPCEVMLVNEIRSRLGRSPLDDFRHPLVQALGRFTRLKSTATGDHLLDKVKEVYARSWQGALKRLVTGHILKELVDDERSLTELAIPSTLWRKAHSNERGRFP